MAKFTGKKFFTISENDTGTEAFSDAYVKFLQEELMAVRRDRDRWFNQVADYSDKCRDWQQQTGCSQPAEAAEIRRIKEELAGKGVVKPHEGPRLDYIRKTMAAAERDCRTVSSGQIKDMIEYLKQLEARIWQLEGHLDWIGWGSEGVAQARDEMNRLKIQCAEYEVLFDIQHERVQVADALYVQRFPRPDLPHGYKPDLGSLVSWLVEAYEALRALVKVIRADHLMPPTLSYYAEALRVTGIEDAGEDRA